jgi:AcrR family transcriptional regulator
MPGGRPRTHDLDAALDRALEVFWRQGYEGTALSDLTKATGMSRPSLYEAFGNKEQLFAKALDRYAEGPGGFSAEALALPLIQEVVERLVYGAVDLTTGPGTPPGCLSVRTAQACGPGGEAARKLAIARREISEAALRRRIEKALADGDLRSRRSPAYLARFVMTLTDGIAVQASAGASRDDLIGVADAAMIAWTAIL